MKFNYSHLLASLFLIVILYTVGSDQFEAEVSEEFDSEGPYFAANWRLENRTHLSPMHKLVDELLINYDTSVIPTPEYGLSLDINHLLILNSIVQLDSKGQKLKLFIYETWSWSDFYLTWDPSMFNNISSTSLIRSKIWLPDIVILNEIQNGVSQNTYVKDNIIPANIRSDGQVKIETPSLVETVCEISIADFPFDKQECELIFGSWSQGVHRLRMVNQLGDIDLSHYSPDAEWKLLNTSVHVETYFIEETNYGFSRLHYKIRLQRRMAFYFWNMVVPAALVNTMSILVFLLPPESNEKISLGITVMLALSVNMMAIRDYVPANSLQTPIISQYTLVCMVATTFTLILSMPVVHVISIGKKMKTAPPDRLLQACAVLSQLVFFSLDTRRNVISICSNEIHQPNSCKSTKSSAKGSRDSSLGREGAAFFREYLNQRQVNIEGSVTVHFNRYFLGDQQVTKDTLQPKSSARSSQRNGYPPIIKNHPNERATKNKCHSSMKHPTAPVSQGTNTEDCTCHHDTSQVSKMGDPEKVRGQKAKVTSKRETSSLLTAPVDPFAIRETFERKPSMRSSRNQVAENYPGTRSSFLSLLNNILLNLEGICQSMLKRNEQIRTSELTNELIYLKWICVVIIFDRLCALVYATINFGFLIYFLVYYIASANEPL